MFVHEGGNSYHLMIDPWVNAQIGSLLGPRYCQSRSVAVGQRKAHSHELPGSVNCQQFKAVASLQQLHCTQKPRQAFQSPLCDCRARLRSSPSTSLPDVHSASALEGILVAGSKPASDGRSASGCMHRVGDSGPPFNAHHHAEEHVLPARCSPAAGSNRTARPDASSPSMGAAAVAAAVAAAEP